MRTPSPRPIQARTRTRPVRQKADQPDLALYDLVGLDDDGRPKPQDRDGPSLGLSLEVSAIVARRMLCEAVKALDNAFGPGFAKRHPELVVALMQAALRVFEDLRLGAGR